MIGFRGGGIFTMSEVSGQSGASMRRLLNDIRVRLCLPRRKSYRVMRMIRMIWMIRMIRVIRMITRYDKWSDGL